MKAPATRGYVLAARFCAIIGSVVLADQACVAESRAPRIASLAPMSGPIGTSVTIQGIGFEPSGNNVQFHGINDFLAGSPVSSESGTSLHFIVTPCPSREPQCPPFFVAPGSYSVVVINANGKSNEAMFTVTRP